MKITDNETVKRALVLAVSLLPLAGALAEAPTYVDHAEVVSVVPKLRTVQVPVQRERCENVAAPAPDTRAAGDVRELDPGVLLVDAIRGDLEQGARVSTREVCDWVTEYHTREEADGFVVTYRYGGQLYTRHVSERPGENIVVQVALEPAH